MGTGVNKFALMEINKRWCGTDTGKLGKKLMALDEDLSAIWKRIHRIPDAHKICNNKFCKVVTLFEVEDAHPLNDGKLCDYSYIAEMFDCDDDWYFQVILTDRYGLIEKQLTMGHLVDYYWNYTHPKRNETDDKTERQQRAGYRKSNPAN